MFTNSQTYKLTNSYSEMKKAIFPGTFDPFTIGHFSVVKRALTFMDEVVIGIGINDSKRKQALCGRAQNKGRCIFRSDNRLCPRVWRAVYSARHTYSARF